MCYHFRFLCVLCCLALGLSSRSAIVVDTIYSPQRDRVIVTYDVNIADGHATIKFLDAKRKLTSSKYSQVSDIKAIFFDKLGGYADKVKFTGQAVNPFKVPAGSRYTKSDDGYFIIGDGQSITFTVDNGAKPTLAIPVYLARYSHHKKTTTYKVLTQCGPLSIKLFKKQIKKPASSASSAAAASSHSYSSNESPTYTETVTTEEIGEDESVSANDEASNRISTVRRLLDEQDKLPMDEELTHNVNKLRDLEYKVSGNLRAQIGEVLAAFNRKKRELEEDQQASAANAQAAAAAQAKQEAQQAQARQDSIMAAQQQEAEKGKKRNMWMIIGAAILGLLGFGGNQVAQHMRNAKNQKSMMEMQQNMIKRAENEAKRRAQSIARNKAHQAVGQVKQKGRQAVQSNVNKLGNAVKNKKAGKNDNGSISI